MDIDVNAIADDVEAGLESLDRIANGVAELATNVTVDPEGLERIADALARLGCLEVTHVLPVDCEDVRAFMKGWEWLTNAHRDTAAAEERKARAMENTSEAELRKAKAMEGISEAELRKAKAMEGTSKAELRKAKAMESIANELGNISSGFTGLENAIREADFGVDTDEIEGGLEKIAKTIYEWSAD